MSQLPDRTPPAPTESRVFESLAAAAWGPMMDAARAVNDPSKDGGSCNLDHCLIVPINKARVTKKMVERLNDAGCSYSIVQRYGRSCLTPNVYFNGQGANNTRVCEAMAKAATSIGLNAWVMYVTD